jgi:hypothetical protein
LIASVGEDIVSFKSLLSAVRLSNRAVHLTAGSFAPFGLAVEVRRTGFFEMSLMSSKQILPESSSKTNEN